MRKRNDCCKQLSMVSFCGFRMFFILAGGRAEKTSTTKKSLSRFFRNFCLAPHRSRIGAWCGLCRQRSKTTIKPRQKAREIGLRPHSQLRLRPEKELACFIFAVSLFSHFIKHAFKPFKIPFGLFVSFFFCLYKLLS